jgi:hypothetical protein
MLPERTSARLGRAPRLAFNPAPIFQVAAIPPDERTHGSYGARADEDRTPAAGDGRRSPVRRSRRRNSVRRGLRCRERPASVDRRRREIPNSRSADFTSIDPPLAEVEAGAPLNVSGLHSGMSESTPTVRSSRAISCLPSISISASAASWAKPDTAQAPRPMASETR